MSTKQVHNKFKDEQNVFCLAFAELFILSDSFNTLNPFYVQGLVIWNGTTNSKNTWSTSMNSLRLPAVSGLLVQKTT